MRGLLLRALEDLNEARERLHQDSTNSSRPPAAKRPGIARRRAATSRMTPPPTTTPWIKRSLNRVRPVPPGKGHRISPYLLRDLIIERPNQVWASGISYIPMAKGFMDLVVILD